MSKSGVSHSTLSFSGRERWAACPVSLHFAKGIEDKGSTAAAEGTLAHLVAEHYVRQRFDLPGAQPGEYPDPEPTPGLARFADLEGEELATETAQWREELRAGGKAYVEFIDTLIPPGLTHGKDFFISLEVRVAAKSIDSRLFGTSDLLIWFPDWKHLVVVDYKFGFADVAVKDDEGAFNPQLAAYLVAALDQCTLEAEGATLAIFQPRRVSGAPGQSAVLSKDEIEAEREALRRDVAHVAYIDGRLAELPDGAGAAELCNPGEHCRYCKAARGACPAMIEGAQTVLDVAAGNVSLLDMPDEDVLALYTLRTAVKVFFEDVTAKVTLMAKAGNPRVTRETRRGRRVFLPNARDTLLALGLDDCLVPGKVEDVASRVPAELHEGIFGRARDSVSLKVVDAPGATAVAKMFQKYSKENP